MVALMSGWSKQAKTGRGVHERHAVDVVPAVGGVDRAVQPLAVVAEGHPRVDHQLVVALDALHRRPAAPHRVDAHRPPV